MSTARNNPQTRSHAPATWHQPVGGASSLARPLAASAGGIAGQTSLSLVFALVLAALLTPQDFGLVAVAASLVALGSLLVDQGLGTALVQRDELRDEHLDTCFWLTLTIGVIVGLGLFLAAPAAARVTSSSEVEPLVRALCVLAPVQGLTVVQQALLRRRMRFGVLATRGLFASLAGGMAGIAAALAGAGPWALATQLIVEAIASVVALWSLTPWRPAARFSPRAARELLAVSRFVLLTSVGTYATRRADALLLSTMLPPASIGLFRMGARIKDGALMFSMRPVQSIALAALAPVAGKPDELRNVCRKLVAFSLLSSLPLLAWVAASAPWTLRVLGPQWGEAVWCVRLLATWGMLEALTTIGFSLLIAVGRPALPSAIVWTSGILSIGAMLIAAWVTRDHDIAAQSTAVAASRTLTHAIAVLPAMIRVLSREARISAASIARAASMPAVCVVASVGVGLALERAMPLPSAEEGRPYLHAAIALAMTGVAAFAPLAFDADARRLARRFYAHIFARRSSTHTASGPAGDGR